MDPGKYNSTVFDINNTLRRKYGNSQNVIFWRCRGLMNSNKNIWREDGISLSREAMEIFSRQIQLAMKCKIT